MQCDLCGKEIVKASYVSIEGVPMEVCSSCARYGKAIPKPKKQPKRSADDNKKLFEKIVNKRELLLLISPDYAKKIKEAREARGFRQIEVAKKLSERESLIQNVENGNIEPPLELARKLERLLSIKLVEEHVEEHKKKYRATKGDSFTLGDFIKIRKR
ncbi:MAG: multiprotein bridging factor aMBF1 [Candidatus Woesearchaeota archaeon]